MFQIGIRICELFVYTLLSLRVGHRFPQNVKNPAAHCA